MLTCRRVGTLSRWASPSSSVDLKPRKGSVEFNAVFLEHVGMDLRYSPGRNGTAGERDGAELCALWTRLTHCTSDKTQHARAHTMMPFTGT